MLDDPHPVTPPTLAPPPDHAVRSVLVVGAGLAGTQTVAALRAQGFDGRVTLVGRETVDPYDRPPLSKHLLDRTEPAWLRDELGVDVHKLADAVHLGRQADRLHVEPHGVVVEAGATALRGDAVVLATGSRAVRPSVWGRAATLHTADDAAALRTALVPGRRLVIVGAGWIGAEVAGVAAAAGVDVTVVEATRAPLSAALGGRVGDLTTGWYADAGVRLLLGAEVTVVDDDGVRLVDGRLLAADVVLAAVGARPDTAWLEGALPRDPDGSLRVDVGHGVIGAPGHVRAVGDIARRWSPRHGWVTGGHWDGALRGPAVAVAALLGGTTSLDSDALADPAPYVFSTQLGHELTIYGQPGPGDELVLRGDPGAGTGWGALWFAAPGVVSSARTPGGATVAHAPAADGGAVARATAVDDGAVLRATGGDVGTVASAAARDDGMVVGGTTHSLGEGVPGGGVAGAGEAPGRTLTAVLAVDRPRDVAAARRLFTARELPRLDPTVAADGARPLRDAVRG